MFHWVSSQQLELQQVGKSENATVTRRGDNPNYKETLLPMRDSQSKKKMPQTTLFEVGVLC